MPDAYLTLKWVHVLMAVTVVGTLLVLALARLRTGRPRAERPVNAHVLGVLHRVVTRVTLPAFVVLFVSGVLMTVGPYSEWSLFAPEGYWALASIVLWVVLGGTIGLASGGIRHLLTKPPRTAAPERRRLWREYEVGLLGALALALLVEGLMVFQPTP